VDNFLYVCNCENDYLQIEWLAELCKGLVEKVLGQSAVDEAIMTKKATEEKNNKYLIVVAHPDDEVLGCVASIYK